MMPWRSFSILFILVLGLFSFKSYSRAPAVDPVMGISIEEYERVDPADAKPFDFSETDQTVEGQNNAFSSAPLAPRSLQLSSDQSKGPPTYFYIILSLLPFVIWYGVMKNLETSDGQSDLTEDLNNTYDLSAQREKRSPRNQDDDTDLPKAS